MHQTIRSSATGREPSQAKVTQVREKLSRRYDGFGERQPQPPMRAFGTSRVRTIRFTALGDG